MIKSFRHRGLKRFYEQGDPSLIRADMRDRIEIMLAQLDVAESVDALRIPNYRLHALHGDMRGYWSVTVKTNWRITFRFEDGSAFDLDLVDYH